MLMLFLWDAQRQVVRRTGEIMADEVTITRGHVTLTIVGFVSMLVFIISSVAIGSFKIAEYRGKVLEMEKEIKELEECQDKIADLELNATLRSIDRRLGNIEHSAMMRVSKAYEKWSVDNNQQYNQ